MKKGFNIDGYLAQAEKRFSSAGGDDVQDNLFFAEGEEDEGSEAEGGGGGQKAPSPTPYSVIVTNSTAGTLTAVLFGKNTFLLTPNFGSAAGITVTPSQTNVSYLFLLQQSADQPFETSLIRIQSAVSTQVTQNWTVTVTDANGQQFTEPIIMSNYFSAYQQQSGIMDVPYSLRIDGNTQVSFPVFATTTVTITFFPALKSNQTRDLSGKNPVMQYGAPAVNVGGVIGIGSLRPAKRRMLGR